MSHPCVGCREDAGDCCHFVPITSRSDPEWVDGRLRRVRSDGTLGTTCVHGVGLGSDLWCGACSDQSDPRTGVPEVVERVHHHDIDERQALFNAATAINRLAMRSKRHPKTRTLLLAKSEELRAAAVALLGDGQPVAEGLAAQSGETACTCPEDEFLSPSDCALHGDHLPNQYRHSNGEETGVPANLAARLAPREADDGLAERVKALSPAVERGVECFHGPPRACLSIRCGSNCESRFDRMHPCPACIYASSVQSYRIEAVLPVECWVTRNADLFCSSFVGAEFGNGVWVEEMCCLPCRIRALLPDQPSATVRGERDHANSNDTGSERDKP